MPPDKSSSEGRALRLQKNLCGSRFARSPTNFHCSRPGGGGYELASTAWLANGERFAKAAQMRADRVFLFKVLTIRVKIYCNVSRRRRGRQAILGAFRQ